MERIIKKDGKVYLVKGEPRAETWYYLGKDPDLYDAEKENKKKRKKE